MSVRTIQNQYRGVNAHLHSYWQHEDTWYTFHTSHIADIIRTLKGELVTVGCTARIEPSLQVRRHVAGSQTVTSTAAREVVLPFSSALPAQRMMTYNAVAVYPLAPEVTQDIAPPPEQVEKPLAWIELLTSDGKPGSETAGRYRSRRLQALRAGVTLVEIDYLHGTPPALHGLADYSAGESDALPYRIAVYDPVHSRAQVMQFGVDEDIPFVKISLRELGTVEFNFGIPYQKTFEEMAYGVELIDYSRPPYDFDSYTAADRRRIANRMLAVVQALYERGTLEDGPSEVPDCSIDEALSRIKAYVEPSA